MECTSTVDLRPPAAVNSLAAEQAKSKVPACKDKKFAEEDERCLMQEYTHCTGNGNLGDEQHTVTKQAWKTCWHVNMGSVLTKMNDAQRIKTVIVSEVNPCEQFRREEEPGTCTRHQGSASHCMVPQVSCRSSGQAGFKHCHAVLSMLRFEAGQQGVRQGRHPVALLLERQTYCGLSY